MHYTCAVKQMLRTVMTWLLVLVVPIEGLAAMTMLSCGPGHLRTPDALPAHHLVNNGHAAHGYPLPGHASNLDAGAAEDHRPSRESTEPNVTGAGKSAAGDLDQLAKFKCSASAVCCLGLPASTVTFDLKISAASVIGTATASLAPFITGGPERPPRFFARRV